MNNNFYIRQEFDKLRERINKELLRRSTYGWWNPLSKPTVGQDKSSPVALHDNGDNVIVNNKTYTINNPSSGSIEETRNINYPAHGDNPGGNPDTTGSSASQFNLDEIKNFLVGLANIKDINLFYGRDEIDYLGFRDSNNIEEVLVDAENDILNQPVTLNTRKKLDPNNGQKDHLDINYPNYKDYTYKNEDQGLYVMESGEYDGEEMPSDGLSEDYFFDDYGAPLGNSNFHPTIKSTTELVRRDWYDQNNDREIVHKIKYEGGIDRSKYGQLPRNPNEGKEYRSRPAYIGKQSSCNVACTGLCSITCDNECSESCTSTCTDRCGNVCTNACTNSCTSCTVHCYSSCKTKCENNVGYSCVNNGAQSFKVIKIGGSYGVPAENKVETKYYSCNGTCSYSCQFYPNKKTECWDSNCMGRCFTSCDISCSSSCFGGCVDNKPEDGKNYFTGKGRGCSSGCTINCIGNCTSSCSGYCVTECWSACKTQCRDNCSYACETECGHGCANICTTSNSSRPRYCGNNCTDTCRNDCNTNCIGKGCRNICGTESHGTCSFNCRINCMMASCTAQCKDACSAQCSSCVNLCDMNCGMCSSLCSTGCEADCNIICTSTCESDCSFNCTQSCTETCGGCSSLCLSCVSRCINRCSVKCTEGCTSCSELCTFWCDSSCNSLCHENCSSYCIKTCEGSCIGYLTSETKSELKGADRPPTSIDYKYQHIENREQERDSFIIFGEIASAKHKPTIYDKYIVVIEFNENGFNILSELKVDYEAYWSTIHSGVYSIDEITGEYIVNENMLPGLVESAEGNFDNSDSVVIMKITANKEITKDDIWVITPFGFDWHTIDGNNCVYIIIKLDPFFLGNKYDTKSNI